MEHNTKLLVSLMTLEEKAGMCSGLDFWHLKGIDRLNIPSVMVTDGPHGLRKQDEAGDHLGINDSIKAVCFPPAVLSACSFDRELIYEMGQAIGREAQANDVSVVLGPGINIKRSPLCGRNFEYYSEDPFLAGETAAAFINGVQSEKTGTSVKHFAANNQEFNRMSNSSELDERTLREIYLAPFEIAVKKANPWTVMCSYNRINGTFASENPWLLTKVLRDEWGFDGFVVSDWGAVNERVAALKAGLELEMPSTGGISDIELVEAVKSGALSEEILDQAVERILNIVLRWNDNHTPCAFTMEEDHKLARRIAEESMVLLKNDNVLPLNKEEKVVFIGGFAKNPRYQGGGSSHINSFRVSSALDSASLIEGVNIHYCEGFSSTDDLYDEVLAAEAIAAAKSADKAVIFAGLPDSFESEGYDRTHMQLPTSQNRLISEILAVQPNTIVVLHNGAPVEMPWLNQVKGLLEAYLGGQAGGEAIVNILYGLVNPCGKLAETIPYKLSDNPSYLNFGCPEKTIYHEGVFVGYRYYDTKEMPVAFPFGHGLSYTSFSYSNLKLSSDSIVDTDTLIVSVDVTNTGNLTGKEIVQFYVRDLANGLMRPDKELKGYEKVELAPGETRTVSIELDMRSFAWYNTDISDWYVTTGDYEILVGASSRNLPLSAQLHVRGSRLLPLKLHMNSTIGEMISDERSRECGERIAKMIDRFFKGFDGDEADDTAVGDDMSAAMAFSLPIRNLVTFGICTKDEVAKMLNELNS